MKPTYILLGADGYYGRNFQYYLSELDYCFITIDKNIPDDFYLSFPIENHLLDYIRCDLNDKDCVRRICERIEFFKDEVIVVNFASISFVDYSIIHPEETINNNVKCCANGYKLSKHFNSKYIYISTDEVRVNKDENELSPYVISKRKCEEFLKSQSSDNIYILRPVNLMDVIVQKKELRQKQRCLLNNIVDSISSNSLDSSKSSVKLHVGTQKRMFMRMRTACDVLFEIDDYVQHSYPEEDDLIKIIDVADNSSLRTNDLPIHDIVYFLAYVYRFKVDEISNPRGVYQDESYLNSDEKWNSNSYKMILNAVDRLLKLK